MKNFDIEEMEKTQLDVFFVKVKDIMTLPVQTSNLGDPINEPVLPIDESMKLYKPRGPAQKVVRPIRHFPIRLLLTLRKYTYKEIKSFGIQPANYVVLDSYGKLLAYLELEDSNEELNGVLHPESSKKIDTPPIQGLIGSPDPFGVKPEKSKVNVKDLKIEEKNKALWSTVKDFPYGKF